MTTNYICVPGEVIVDDQLAYSSLYPQIDESGLLLWRRRADEPGQISNQGPHVVLCVITPMLLMAVPRETLCSGAKYSFSGPCLGLTDEFGGLAGRDGTNTRLIVHLEFEVLYHEATLRLSAFGEAGPILPVSSTGRAQENKTQFLKVLCPIPLAVIPGVARGRHGFFLQKKLECETTAEYIEAIKNGPPKDA